MTKHTPGPWTTVGRAIGGAKVGIARDEHNPQPFATVHGSGSDDGDKIADANSRLIASAPDLLGTLVAVQKCLDGHSIITHRVRLQIRDAIAKAGG
jgi:hypothetical protein